MIQTDMKIAAPRSLTELVTERLEQAIVDGVFALGEAISEETLAKTFGVSRTPVRDALSALQRSGLVIVLSKRGSFVFQPTRQDAAMLCEYRFMLECEGMRLSFTRAPSRTLAALNAAIEAMEKAVSVDAVAYGRADTLYHRAFLDFCGNPYLCEAYRLASCKVAALRTHLTAHDHERRQTSFDEHQAMAEFFGRGDIEKATAILQAHISRTQEIYDLALRRVPFQVAHSVFDG